MADLSFHLQDVDTSSIEASTGVPDPVPPGNYTLQVEGDELKQTADGTGMLLKVTYSIVSGAFEGRKIFAQFNVRNKSAQAQTIGIGELKALCKAVGVPFETASAETEILHFKPFNAVVGMEKQQINPKTGDLYAPRNRVTKYIPQGDAAPVAAGPATMPAGVAVKPVVAAQSVQRPAASGGLPWQR